MEFKGVDVFKVSGHTVESSLRNTIQFTLPLGACIPCVVTSSVVWLVLCPVPSPPSCCGSTACDGARREAPS